MQSRVLYTVFLVVFGCLFLEPSLVAEHFSHVIESDPTCSEKQLGRRMPPSHTVPEPKPCSDRPLRTQMVWTTVSQHSMRSLYQLEISFSIGQKVHASC